MASLQGLPPLPKSLSGANLLEHSGLPEQLRLHHPTVPPPPPPITSHPEAAPSSSSASKRMPPPPPPPPPRKLTTLDTQLAILRKEMYSLRELDLNLLSQLWSLNESIQEFRQIQEALSPPSPSSDCEDDILYSNLAALPEHHTLSSSSSRSSSDYRDV
ncbi:leucine repeat adapter protein 25 isoform X2 [Nilaparvata lugens]|nr:leucine repeat adapter protein 25 isoform X2 [Nilaparvata lugens]